MPNWLPFLHSLSQTKLISQTWFLANYRIKPNWVYESRNHHCTSLEHEHWPAECKSVRLYLSDSLVAGESQDEPDESVDDRRKSGGRMVDSCRSQNDIELRTPSLTGRSLLPWRSSKRFKFWFSTFRWLTCFYTNVISVQVRCSLYSKTQPFTRWPHIPDTTIPAETAAMLAMLQLPMSCTCLLPVTDKYKVSDYLTQEKRILQICVMSVFSLNFYCIVL